VAQESLTDELVGMAAAIRDSTRALEGRLAERGALLEDADDALQRSLENTRKSKARARQIYTRYDSRLRLISNSNSNHFFGIRDA